MRVLLITGNKHKAQEVAAILAGHVVETLALDLPEIQSLNPEEIILEKLAAARRKVKEKDVAIAVEDVAFWIGETGLPGPFVRWFNETIGPQGLVAIGKAFGTDRARATCHVGAILPGKRKPAVLVGTVRGKLVAARGASGFGFDPVFEPDGWDETYAEMTPDEKNAISHRGKAFAQLKPLLDACVPTEHIAQSVEEAVEDD